MPCTTILVGKDASYDGSTMMARNEDTPSGEFTSKAFVVVNPKDQPRHYQSKISKVEIDLPDNPLRYTSMPDQPMKQGIWGEAGINEKNVAMTETETITSNPRVLGADPLVEKGVGEEDYLTIVLPYIKSAREGVKRLGMIHEKYGTYEMNGMGIQDKDEIWWFESIGGHHWMAKRVPDDAYAVIPNQMGIDFFDFTDAFGEQKNYMCSKDLIEFIEKNHLDLRMPEEGETSVKPLKEETQFIAREAFGSHDDSDHIYNTARTWFIERYLNPRTYLWDGENADYSPESDYLPWCLVPEKKITVEDIKYTMSGHYQGTPYDVYDKHNQLVAPKYRPIGINRTAFVAVTQIRPYLPEDIMSVEWIAEGSNVHNAMVPFYTNVTTTPKYFRDTTDEATTDNFYWANRFAAALADPHFGTCAIHIERYQNKLHSAGHAFLNETDAKFLKEKPENVQEFLEKANKNMAKTAKKETQVLLNNVLYEASNGMKNGFARSDA